jgi:hypothetical protein
LEGFVLDLFTLQWSSHCNTQYTLTLRTISEPQASMWPSYRPIKTNDELHRFKETATEVEAAVLGCGQTETEE